ncbi:hypothetical protein [Aurantimonas endophytica]|uniref:Uncharacterized protein n=1 Tax=Aurantimonas endophytica TaxID=1522175 RepID=A0A7W6HCI0_9HYPH|nr:hypothetical protein [Aurantimonas endophytica]MBB4002634.1 hypothetical protein [Aurantimonas endophytica]MCO6403515.1 hypothetical protein [Aurantimonas endophytica]
MAPPDSALYGPAGAVPSSGGFEEFWSVWPRKHKLAKAKAAYKAIAPDADLHATIAEAARAWATHYASNNVEKKWVPEPASWLANERWLEDLPLIHGDAKGAAIAKAKANAPAKPKAAATFKVDATCKIEAAELEMDGNDQVIVVTFAPEGGNSFDRRIVLESPDPKRQAEGQGEFSRLCEAINVDEPKDAEDLMGFSLHIWGGNKGLAYNRLPPAWLTDRSAQAA